MEEARTIHLTGRKDFVFIFSSLIIFCSQFQISVKYVIIFFFSLVKHLPYQISPKGRDQRLPSFTGNLKESNTLILVSKGHLTAINLCIVYLEHLANHHCKFCPKSYGGTCFPICQNNWYSFKLLYSHTVM